MCDPTPSTSMMSGKMDDTEANKASAIPAQAAAPQVDIVAVENAKSQRNMMYMFAAFAGIIIFAELGSVIALAFKLADSDSSSDCPEAAVYESSEAQMPNIVINTASGGSSPAVVQETPLATRKPPVGASYSNVCSGKKIDIPNRDCVVDAMSEVGPLGPQAGANVTKGYQGNLEVEHDPITTPYWQNKMCPVNVHWHLGAEHFSAGEYDNNGSGPSEIAHRRKLAGKTREGFQCGLYDDTDEKFTKPYEWKHCVDMEVGQTYEVHWPHSAAGACGTPNQYQTPFYDGVFCNAEVLDLTAIQTQVGVQAQVFTIVNDEAYYWPDLMRGMIVDGERGQDMAMYTGSTTGTSRNNEICSGYSPITWQVDRKCHLISASAFDKMCADMKAQRDDMSDDLYAHGSRELVADDFAADNHQRRLRHA